MKEIEDDTNKYKDIPCSWKELISLKCPYYPKPSIDSVQYLSKYQWHFYRNRTNSLKLCMELYKTLNNQSNFEKEQSWRHHTSWFQTVWQSFSIQNSMIGLPWWRNGWESACQCRGHGFEPWSGKILHAVEQLGPWATITEPARLEPVLRSKRGHDSERPAHHDEEWPLLATARESPRTEMRTQHSHK